MNPSYSALATVGFVLGWSVAWPPGPINAEIARRCSARGFFAGFALLVGACSGDALWAIMVALGVGFLFVGATARTVMGIVSIVLLLALAGMFARGAFRAGRNKIPSAGREAPPGRFDRPGGAYALGATMALTSPWNVAFWFAAMGRPELAGADATHVFAMAAAVVIGALTWGALWAGATTLLHRGLEGRAARLWAIFVDAATAALMLYFAAGSAMRLVGGG